MKKLWEHPYIGFEKDPTYFNAANDRINKEQDKLTTWFNL